MAWTEWVRVVRVWVANFGWWVVPLVGMLIVWMMGIWDDGWGAGLWDDGWGAGIWGLIKNRWWLEAIALQNLTRN